MPIGAGFDKYIGTRASAVDPTQTEYFNKATNVGFGNPGELAGYASTLGSGKDISPTNIFSVLDQGFTPPTNAIDPTAPPTTTTQPELPDPTATITGTNYITSLSQDLEAKRKTLEDRYKTEIDTITKAKADAEKRMADIEAKQAATIEDDVEPLLEPFRADLETSERQRLKVEENYFANQSMVEELSTLLTQGTEAIKLVQNQSIPRIIADRQLSKVMSDVAARAGVLEATIAARNGQIAQAYNLIDRSVQATVADRKDRLSYFNTLLNFYENQKDDEGNKLIQLEKREQQFLDAEIGLLESDLKNAQATADYVKELFLSPDTALMAAESGITLNDSVETINKKLADYTIRKQQEQQHQQNKAELAAAGVTASFVNRGGEIQRVSDGYAFTSPEDFKRLTGLTLEEAGARGLIADFNANVLADKQQVLSLMQGFPDAGIRATDSLSTAESKLNNSRLYRESVRPPASAGGGGGLTSSQALGYQNQIEDNLRANPVVKAYGELVNFGVPTVIERFNSGQADNVSDTVLMRTLAKVTDPTTGVREEEYRTFEDAIGAVNRVFTLPKKWIGRGRLNTEGRSAMIREIQDRFDARLTDYVSAYDYYTQQAGRVPGVTIPPPFTVAEGDIARLNTAGPKAPSSSPAEQQPTDSFMKKVGNWLFGN